MKTRNVLVLCAALFVGATPIASAQTKSAPAHTSKASTVDANEARIADLHAKLKITPAQEELWKSVTEVMRANAKAMEPLRKARAEKAPTMTAVEDFTSYAEIADVHADGIKKFVPVFTALYDSMSDAQKKNADTMFRGGGAPKSTASKSH
jgi:protein CpxP